MRYDVLKEFITEREGESVGWPGKVVSSSAWEARSERMASHRVTVLGGCMITCSFKRRIASR